MHDHRLHITDEPAAARLVIVLHIRLGLVGVSSKSQVFL
jgi:hypothetical protein